MSRWASNPNTSRLSVKIERQKRRKGNKTNQCDFGEPTDDQSIKNIRQIFPHERPSRPIERIGLLPASYIPTGKRRYHRTGKQKHEQYLPPCSLVYKRETFAITEIEQQCAYADPMITIGCNRIKRRLKKARVDIFPHRLS